MEEKIIMVSPKFVLIFLIFILFVHITASINEWYWTYRWFDIPMHFLGGFWLAGVFFWLNSKFKVLEIPPFSLSKFVMVIGFVALIGVLWEFWEFICDFFILHGRILQQSAADTMKDLFFDFVGGTAFFIIYKYLFKKESGKFTAQ